SRYTERGKIKVSASTEESYLLFSVEDTGAGMNPERLLTIFDEFNTHVQSVPGETGLGLAISKRFVTFLGGEIRVKSAKGKGTIFTVKIPFIYQKEIAEEKLLEAA
ncbi:MAG: hybrid sensor histidine kinase/response regulator, partial [Deltaproteobacteria bacterium]|nr:hybrid sensor histidine kinase/response regulator [Deltaproteobacteria bacterium]